MNGSLNYNRVQVDSSISVQNCVSKCTIQWQIPNFRELCVLLRNRVYIESKVISYDGPERLYRWKFRLYPQGSSAEDIEYLSLFIKALEITSENEVCITFAIGDRKLRLIEKQSPHKYANDMINFQGFPRLVKRTEVLDETIGLMRDNTLVVFCEIIIISNSPTYHIEAPRKELDYLVQLNELDNYENLLVTKKYSDIQFSVKGKTVLAHKVILSSRNPIFAEMLDNNDNTITLDDINHEEFEELLRFLYCGKVLQIDKNAKNLLAAAHKYNVQNLKVMCEECLSKNLSVDNALECLQVASRNQCNVLERRTKDFIVAHADDMVMQTNFQNIGQAHYPDLYAKVKNCLKLEYQQEVKVLNKHRDSKS